MNKAGFLKELAFHLHKMEDTEKKKFITYYDEMLSDYMEHGMSEEDAVIRIGAPIEIANELLENYESVQPPLPSTRSKVVTMILLILGFPLWGSLLLTAVLLILSAYTILWCIPVITGASSISFLLTSLIGIVGSPFIMADHLSMGLIQLGTGITSIGLAFLLGIATLYLSKKLVVITKHFNTWCISICKKKVVSR